MEKEIIIENKLDEINRITQFIEEMGMSLRIPSDITMSINLAIEEAISNIIKHAFPKGETGDITLKVSVAPGQLTFLIVDEGVSFDPTQIKEHAEPLPLEKQLAEGLGLFLIRRTMDEVTYSTIDSKNYLTLIKNIDSNFEPEATMKINICKIEDITIVAIEGRLDTVNSYKFEHVVQNLLQESASNLIINCEGLMYISSSGLRSFLLLMKSVAAKKGTMILEGMRPEIRKIFDLTGSSSLFTIR